MSRTLHLPSALVAQDTLAVLETLVQDLAAVCRSPLAVAEPEVGRATLAMSEATTTVSRVARAEAIGADGRAQIHAAMERARAALENARRAVEASLRTRERGAELTARAIRSRLATTSASPAVPPLLRAWTTARDLSLTCPSCAMPFRLRYRYRFMDGLAPREIACPRPRCRSVLSYYCPVNSVDLSVQAVPEREAAPSRDGSRPLTVAASPIRIPPLT